MSSSKELWQVWEDDVAERTGGQLVKCSGRLDRFKGDVKSETMLIDAKDTETDGYSVSERFWSELSSWARNEGREPAIAVRMEDDNGAIEVAVTTEMYYAERHPGYEPPDQLKKQKQRKVNRKCASGKPVTFLLGNFRLTAWSFDEFAEGVLREG